LILNVASSAKLPEDEAAEIAAYLGEKYDEEGLIDNFFQLFIQLEVYAREICIRNLDEISIIEQPFRIPVVAAVAFYGNYVKQDITVEAVKRVAAKAQEALNAGKWRDFKQLLRCLACLQSVYEGDGVFVLLRQLFDTVVDLQSANENDVSSACSQQVTFTNYSGCWNRAGQDYSPHYPICPRCWWRQLP
jgi:nuclear cap-binding protein subunit 1